jgi:hypothetical protein
VTFEELQAMVPDAAVESSCCGELVIYTGLRIDSRNESGPLIPFECPSCDCDDQGDNPKDCADLWHVDRRAVPKSPPRPPARMQDVV